ncbi:blue light receptor [Pseudogymnoascus verrucosus]|uniref:Blue light receptor n=1 Tax=Pseudogymnoascus verrucosus TaxID=342668 RepID=A0A1B8GKX7_9PEZI|nr:blue light receptor [Pseudogymnoascus verrucosus]OBT96487.1 blue light receptor [Pseudogymnoascus verrucosus]
MPPEPAPAIAILANDPSTMYYGGQDDGDLCMINEPPMTDTLEENHVHSLGDLPIFESGDLRLVDLGVQASQDDETSAPQTYNENAINVTGAGATSTYFATQSSQVGNIAGNEFTKNRSWMQEIVEELKDLIHVLAPDGRVLYISDSVKQLTGYTPEDIIGKSIVDFIHPDDSAMFVREFNNSVTSGDALRVFYRFRKQTGGDYAVLECHGQPHLTSGTTSSSQNNSSTSCNGFFMVSRPYPSKNAALLDSFLEHKIENERLMKKIEDLRREDAEEQDDYQPQYKKEYEGPWEQYSARESNAALPVGMGHSSNSELLAMPPPANTTSWQGHEDASSSSKPDSAEEKSVVYKGATNVETIEMLTGLRYQDGERSKGISTGDASPTLTRGDSGATMQVDKDGRSVDKKKKLKTADKYICTDCGTLDSPEWRKGPEGPKTLCNACGLRWAKQEKKKSGGFTFNNGGGDMHL